MLRLLFPLYQNLLLWEARPSFAPHSSTQFWPWPGSRRSGVNSGSHTWSSGTLHQESWGQIAQQCQNPVGRGVVRGPQGFNLQGGSWELCFPWRRPHCTHVQAMFFIFCLSGQRKTPAFLGLLPDRPGFLPIYWAITFNIFPYFLPLLWGELPGLRHFLSSFRSSATSLDDSTSNPISSSFAVILSLWFNIKSTGPRLLVLTLPFLSL